MAFVPASRLDSVGLLVLRLGAGFLMAWLHGLNKFSNYSAYSEKFGDPIGVGPGMSLFLATFAELVCAGLVMVGLFTRFAAFPVAFTMLVAGVIVHAADPLAKKELAFLYLCIFTTLVLTGGGRYSIDHYLKRRWPDRLRFL